MMSDNILEQAARRQTRRQHPKDRADDLLSTSFHIFTDINAKGPDHQPRRRVPSARHNEESIQSVYFAPFIRIKCEEEFGKAAINSMSAVSSMSATFAQHVGIKQTTGTFSRNTEISIGEKIYRLDLKVEETGPDLTLGVDFLHRNKCILNFQDFLIQVGDNKTSFLPEKEIPLRFRPTLVSGALSQTI